MDNKEAACMCVCVCVGLRHDILSKVAIDYILICQTVVKSDLDHEYSNLTPRTQYLFIYI